MKSINEQARINWVSDKLKGIARGNSILDAGAGEQQFRQFCDNLVYTSQDFAAYTPTELVTGLQVDGWDYGKLDIISDITNIPRSNESFDVILCTEVFEHIPDPLSALKEFSRLLKPGGKLILTAPFASMTHFAPYHYSTGFSRFFYEKHLPLNNFKILEIVPNGNYFSSMLQETSRIPYVAHDYQLPKPNRIQLLALKIVEKMLNKYVSIPNRSSELMCLGWHVVAVKN